MKMRDGSAGLLCYLAGFKQCGEEEDRQISGLAKRVSPTEAFLIRQRYRNGLIQGDSIAFRERSIGKYKEVSPAGKVELALRKRC